MEAGPNVHHAAQGLSEQGAHPVETKRTALNTIKRLPVEQAKANIDVNKTSIVLLSTVLIASAAVFIFMAPKPDDTPTKMVVYQDPNCGCCSQWVEHIIAAGIEVETRPSSNMSEVKFQQGIARNLQSCHTGIIDGYIVEGHVPAEDVLRMLEERPAIKGLSVPGMPIGSPGMEQGSPADYQAYDVVAFDGAGNLSRYRHVEGGVNAGR